MISPISVLVVLNMRKRKWWRQKNVWKRTNFSRFFTRSYLYKNQKKFPFYDSIIVALLDLHFLSSHFWNISYNGHVISTFVSRLRHTSVIFPIYKNPCTKCKNHVPKFMYKMSKVCAKCTFHVQNGNSCTKCAIHVQNPKIMYKMYFSCTKL